MKKKLSLLIALSALTLSVGAAVGVGAGVKSAEVRADELADTDYIYLDNSSFYEGNERYAAYFFTDGVGDQWVDFTWDASIGYNKVERKAFDKVIICRMNGGAAANNWDNRWNQTANLDNHTGIYKPYSKSGKDVGGSWEYPLTVGDKTEYMIPHGSDKVKCTLTANAEDIVSLKQDQDTAAGTLNPESKASNNITSDSKKIKVGGSVTVYVSKTGWSTWVSGYGQSSIKLQDFCDAILAKPCDAKDLGDCGWDGLEPEDKSAFNGADVIPGDGKTYVDYGNVINEAATRYDLLVAKGATPIDGITFSSIRFLPSTTVLESNYTAVIILASTLALIAVGGYFLLRKARKED